MVTRECKEMVFQWSKGAHHKVSADVAADVCMKLEAEGRLTAKELVNESRAEDAPLHGEFEWNDGVAAEKYRETQGAHIIRHLTVKIETPEDNDEIIVTRSFVRGEEENTGHYMNIFTAIENPDASEYVLTQAVAGLKAWLRKYENLEKLRPIIGAIREFIEKIETDEDD